MIPFLGTIDLSDVTTELGSLSTAVVTAAGLVIASALAVGAVYFGGRSLWRFFKSLAR